jgi:RNA methyltransferase, TrmH family
VTVAQSVMLDFASAVSDAVTMKTISSRQNPLVREFRDLASAPDPARLLLDGVHLVREAHRAGAAIRIVAVAASTLERDTEERALARELAGGGTEVVTATDQVIGAMSPVRSPSAIVAIAERTPATPADVCRHAGFVLAAVDVQDPGNLGSLIRAAEAGGVTGVVVTGTSAHPFSWKAVRGSMGSVLRLPVASVASTDAVLACMRQFGLHIVAAVARDGVAPEQARWRGKVGLLLGGEGPGLSADVIASTDERVTIPMASPVESLNVAVAAGILVYAARQQRQ